METFERELKYRSPNGEKVETVYFRELTAGERLQLTRGQRIKASPDAKKATMELELGEMMEKNHRLVQMTLVTSDAKPVYKRLQDLQSEPDSKVKALIKLATEINKEESEGGAEAGNA